MAKQTKEPVKPTISTDTTSNAVVSEPLQTNILEIMGYYNTDQIKGLIERAYTHQLFKTIDKSLFTSKDLLCIIGLLVTELGNTKKLVEVKDKEIENIQNFYKKQAVKPISREEALKVLSNTDSWAPQTW